MRVLPTSARSPTSLTSTHLTTRNDANFDVRHSDPIMNTVLIMNIADKNVRKTVVHAVDKNPIIAAELGGLEKPASQRQQR